MERLKRRSTLIGIANVLFACGVVLLLTTLFNDADRYGTGKPPIVVAFILLAGTVACWFAAARSGKESDEPETPQVS